MFDPFFMHPSDNLGLTLIIPPLSNDNYHSLFQSMLVALSSKNKLWFIDEILILLNSLGHEILVCMTYIDLDISQILIWMDMVYDV